MARAGVAYSANPDYDVSPQHIWGPNNHHRLWAASRALAGEFWGSVKSGLNMSTLKGLAEEKAPGRDKKGEEGASSHRIASWVM